MAPRMSVLEGETATVVNEGDRRAALYDRPTEDEIRADGQRQCNSKKAVTLSDRASLCEARPAATSCVVYTRVLVLDTSTSPRITAGRRPARMVQTARATCTK